MVVADAESPGPVRKKARLSLKKGSNHVSTNTPTSIEVKEEPLHTADTCLPDKL
jgi:hypothetical protein